MTNKHIDRVKGGAKEAADALTGDRHLKSATSAAITAWSSPTTA